MKSESQEDSFASLFEKQAPAARAPSVRVGDSIESVVVQVGKEAVYVEMTGKRQAYFAADELRAPDGTMTVAVGDKIRGRVVEMDKSGSFRLGRSMGRASGIAALERARETGVSVEGKVTGLNKGGLEVDLGGGARGFCPMSQADSRFLQDPSTLIGKSLLFAVTDVRDGGKSVVVSRRAVLEREAREASGKILETLAKGANVRGTVTSVREFGAFVDLGGIEGLIPVSEISHERGINAADRLKGGDVVEVQVKDIGAREGDATPKITLSLKALTADPWSDLGETLREGKVVSGSVTRAADFGLFVRVAPGIEGLLHASELSAKTPLASFSAGAPISVVVKSVDKAAKKVSLVLAPEGALEGAHVKPVAYGVGAIVTGIVERIETYGLFLQIEGTKGRAGRGLCPVAETGTVRGTDLRKAFPEGTKLTAKILESGDGRMRLSLRAVKDDEERSLFEGFKDQAKETNKLGTFGDLLAKASQSKQKKK